MNTNNLISSPQDQQPDGQLEKSAKPGALHGQVWLTVQTTQAQQLIQGRDGTAEKAAIIGLVGFADRLRVIWQAARDDDPYADWWLIKVHEAIALIKDDIACYQMDLMKQLEQMASIDVSIATSQQPYRVQLQFANPYAYRSAQRLAEYDNLVCTALTARHIGMLDSAAYTQIQKTCARRLRALFMIPQGYRYLKINRDLVRERKGHSHEAHQLMGELPNDVLSGVHHAPLVPQKVNFPTVHDTKMHLHPGTNKPGTDLSANKKDDG